MRTVLKNARLYDGRQCDILIENGFISDISESVSCVDADSVFNIHNKCVFPGFIDVHVHFREPGFSYKETIASGTKAAAAGGYTDVCTMPNLNPVPDCRENLDVQLELIKKSAVVNVHPFGALTFGECGERVSDMKSMADMVAGFSDDGRGVQSDDMMRLAMKNASGLGKIVSAHCEDNSLLRGGYIHDGAYARQFSHRGICSESEWRPIERDIDIARETGCSYHVCHVSAKESVELIRNAKHCGIDITCETAPHYLVFDDSMLRDEGAFKMNPPIRSHEDRAALIEGICDGTIDMIATDHAPHSAEEKNAGLMKSLNGIVGLETAFPILYTHLVKKEIISLKKLIELMSFAPGERFGITCGIEKGLPANITVFDLDEKYTVNPQKFFSKGRSTPFYDMEVYGRCLLTMVSGRPVYMKGV